jgi:hypothetical protein
MTQNDNNTNILKHGNKRGPKPYEVKPPSLPPEYCECTLCWKTYDIHKISLQQKIIDDRHFCESCWNSQIMQKEYQDQNDIIQEFYKQFDMRTH